MRPPDRNALLKVGGTLQNCAGSQGARSVHRPGAMVRVSSFLTVLAVGTLVGCGSSASLEFANAAPSAVDAAEDPYPDAATGSPEAGAQETAFDAGEAPKCAPGKDGKANVCVRVLRGSDGPSITEEAKAAFGIDGTGTVLVGLASVKPGREVAFVASTWLPTESSGAGKFAATELPKIAELSVAPGTYWAFAVFRDQEPYIRNSVAIGDYVPRLVELPQVTVVAEMGANVDVRVHPVRAIDVEVHLATAPAGSGAGAIGAWLVGDKKILGEGRSQCGDLSGGKADVVRVFTTYTGDVDVAAALFDFTLPVEDGSGTLPGFPAGTAYNDPTASSARVKIVEGDWLTPKKRIDLDKLVSGTKPADPSTTCATYAYAPPK